MSLNEQLTQDMKTAMKAKDKVTLNTIRTLKSAVKNAAIEQGGADMVLDDAEITTVIRKQIKQRQDSITQYSENGRPELAETEQNEIDVLERYLPTPLTEEEVAAFVAEAIAETGASSRADMGKVMGIMQKKTEGRTDGKTISQAVMKALS
ncbi:MAG: GatB/YqeY domain-containing protein [Akkermansiaceae bacterium]